MSRLFLAVWPPEQVVALLRALPRTDEPGVRWVQPADWHVTLRFLGSADPSEVVARLDDTRLQPARAVVGPVVSLLGPGLVVVPVAGLDELAAVVSSATADLVQPPDPRPFAGHLTMARLRGKPACGVVGERLDAEFEVGEVVLVDSETRPDGARYRVIGRWPVG